MELKTYISPLLKWWWLLLAAAVIAGATSYLAVSQQPPVYQARATLMIGSAINNPNPIGNEFWLSQQLAQTYTDIAQRAVVKDAVQEALGLTWLPAYSARTLPNTQLIEITVNDSNPERAMVVANELAEQLILQTPVSGRQEGDSARQAFTSQQLDELELRIRETEAELLTRQQEMAQLVSARQIAEMQNQIAALDSKRTILQSNYATLLASSSQGAVNRLSVIEPATMPYAPIGPDVMGTVMTAAVIGLSLAVAAAYLLEYLDDTIKTPNDVQSVATLPTLSGIAEYRPENGALRSLVTISKPRSPIAEAYRSLRTAVLFSNVDQNVRTLLISSPGPSEGKSFTAANLAVVMAQAGHKVLLVDADFRRPTQHRIFNITRNYGLTDMLIEVPITRDPAHLVDLFIRINRALSRTAQPNLYVLPCGSIPPNPAELIGSAKMKALLGLLTTQYDIVIIDSPPTLAVTDAVILGTRVDSVLLVSRAGSTRRNQLKSAVERFREVNANMAGVVLNRVTASSGDYYAYYYRRSYYNDDSGDGGAAAETPAAEQKQEGGLQRSPLNGLLGKLLS